MCVHSRKEIAEKGTEKEDENKRKRFSRGHCGKIWDQENGILKRETINYTIFFRFKKIT